MNVKKVLTVGGSDPSGASGIQADIKVFSAYRVYGMSVITALTSQNSCGIKEIMRVPADILDHQFRTVHEDIDIDSMKIGMISSIENINILSGLLSELKLKNIVLDPVFASSSGTHLIEQEGIEKMIQRLFPLIDVITPNIDEASILSGIKIENPGDMKEAAKIIAGLGPSNVLVKGGHLKTRAIDIFYDGVKFETLDAPRLTEKEFRGTGCALSAALAAGLAKGSDMNTSVEKAKEFVARSIKTGYEDLGKGMGILNHNHPLM